jgi:autotransporter-associated beta strand protein
VLKVTDSANTSAQSSLTITVANTNDAPVFAADPITGPAGSEGQAYSSSIAGSASDVDAGDSLAYSKVSGPSWLSVAPNGTLSGTPGSGAVGVSNFIVRATDTGNAHDEATLSITIVGLPENNGVWTNVTGGSWTTASNWSAGLIASGASRSADFSTLDLTADATVTLNGPRKLGSLIFGDTTPSHTWTLASGSGGPLTLEVSSGSPIITVNNSSVIVAVALAGTQGLTKAGAGTLALSGANTYGGDTTLNAGTLTISGNHSAATGGWAINGGTTANFQAGSSVAVAGGKTILLANSGTAHSLNAAGTVANAGSLTLRGSSTLNLNSGGNWTQGGMVTLEPQTTHTDALVSVNTGATFTYTGSPAIDLSASTGNKQGTSTLSLNGGTFITGQGFHNATTSGSGAAYLKFSAGGTLRLSANVAALATTAGTPFNVQLGAGGGVIDTNGYSTTLSQAITGSSSFTKAGAGTLNLTGSNSSLGNVTVASGTLSMSGLYFVNAASVTIASGGSLGLNFTGTETIAALTIDGTVLSPGTYNATTHPGFLTGSGSLSVISASAPPSFATWANSRSLSGDPEADQDHDGTADILEYVFGTDPQESTSAGLTSQKTDAGLVITFPRDDVSEFSNLSLTVESGHDLQSWPQVFQVGHMTETSSPGVTVIENGDEPDTIIVTISCNGCASRFARVTALTGGP